MPGPSSHGSEVAISRWSKSPVACSSTHSHSSLVEHRAAALLEHPAGARVDHDDAGVAEVAAVAPARAVGRRGPRGRRTPRAAARRRRPPSPRPAARRPGARRARGCRGAGRPSTRTSAPLMCSFHQWCERASSSQASEMFQSSWTSWSSKIIIVDDGGEEPADRRLAPALVVEPRVLLEVEHHVAGRLGRCRGASR